MRDTKSSICARMKLKLFVACLLVTHSLTLFMWHMNLVLTGTFHNTFGFFSGIQLNPQKEFAKEGEPSLCHIQKD